MPKKQAKADKSDSKKVNVEIAPGIGKRVEDYIKFRNEHPDRSSPLVTFTDVVNEALKEFFEDHESKNRRAGAEVAGSARAAHRDTDPRKESRK
jgi:hypothetical protein